MFLFCAAFYKAPSILNASFVGGAGVGGVSYNLYPGLLVVLFWSAFLSVSLFLVCFLGVIHMSQGDFTDNHKQVVNRLKIPQGLSTLLFHRRSEVLQGEGSAVIHCMKNDLLYKDATCLCSLSAAF